MLTLNSSDLGAGLKSPLWTSKASLNSEHSQRHGPSPLKSDLKKRRDFWFSLQIHFTPANWNLGSFRHWTIGKLNIGQLDNWAIGQLGNARQFGTAAGLSRFCKHESVFAFLSTRSYLGSLPKFAAVYQKCFTITFCFPITGHVSRKYRAWTRLSQCLTTCQKQWLSMWSMLSF